MGPPTNNMSSNNNGIGNGNSKMDPLADLLGAGSSDLFSDLDFHNSNAASNAVSNASKSKAIPYDINLSNNYEDNGEGAGSR